MNPGRVYPQGKSSDTGAESHHHRRSYQLQRDRGELRFRHLYGGEAYLARQGLPGKEEHRGLCVYRWNGKAECGTQVRGRPRYEYRCCRICQVAKRLPHSYPCGQLFSRLGDSLQGWCRETCLFRSRNQGQHVNPRLARHRRWQDSLCRQALRATLRFGHLLS